jgi:DNA-binding transcriptional regulator YiaG
MALGVTQGALSRWERGNRRIPEMAARLLQRLLEEHKK